MEKQELESLHGEVMTTSEATALYEFISFCAPYVLVRRRSDGVRGLLRFQHAPRFYFGFEAEDASASA